MGSMKKTAIFLSVLLAAVLAAGSGIAVSAGQSESYVVTETSVSDGHINTGTFRVHGDVTAEGSTILFNGGESESDLIAAGRVDNFAEYGVEDLFIASLDLTFTDMAEGGKFSILFGMESLRTGIGDAGTIQLLFEEEGGRIFFTAYEYLADDVFRILYDRRQVSGLAEGDTAALELFVNTQKQVTFIVDGDTLLDETQLRSNDGAGFVGLFSEGTNKLSVQNYSITAYTYDTPENPDYLETFDNDAYNANMFYSESKASPLSPSYLTAEDGQLVFSNTAGAFFSTRYQYSNFVLEFDITDLQRTAEKDAGGNITALISGWFGIGFGCDDYNEIADTTVQQGSWLQFEGTQDGADHTVPCASPRYILYDNDFASTGKYNPLVAQGMKFNPWSSEAEGKIINVRFSVLDGIVSLYLKYEGESWGTPELTYDMGYTPSGYVRIFQWGETGTRTEGIAYNQIGNFAIDNFSISNADYEDVKQSIEAPEFKTNVIANTPDFDYDTKPDAGDLIGDRLENGDPVRVGEGGGCSSVLFGGSAAGAAVLAAAAAFGLRRKRK